VSAADLAASHQGLAIALGVLIHELFKTYRLKLRLKASKTALCGRAKSHRGTSGSARFAQLAVEQAAEHLPAQTEAVENEI
jgi:hypothetical protein